MRVRSRSTSSTSGGASLVLFVAALGCLKLLARMGFVAYAIAKIVMGSKYRSHCPVQDLVPVFAITSGCFQFLLFAFTCERPEGSLSVEDSEREAFRRKFRFITRCIAAVLNGGILLTGTAAVVHAQYEVNLRNHTTPCHHFVTSMMNTSITAPTTTDGNQTGYIHNNHPTTSDQTSQPQRSNHDCIDLSTDNTTPDQDQNHSVTVNNDAAINTTSLNPINMTDTHSFDDTEEASPPILCLDKLLTFVTVAACVDWFIAISGTALLCFLWCRSVLDRRRNLVT